MTAARAEKPVGASEHTDLMRGHDQGQAEALVSAFIGLSPYRKAIAPLLGDITRIALANRQVGEALATVERRADFRRTGRLDLAGLGNEKAVILAFLEHIRFASPDFLRSVGEWPLGEIRGRV
jgi:hypothetical protein